MSRRVDIPENELEWSFSRSGGPGGQKVNRTASRVSLRWDYRRSRALEDGEKARLDRSSLLAGRRTADGALVVHEDRERSQAENRRLAREKLHELVRRALARRRRRIPTRKPASAERQRVERKRRRGERKRSRRWRPGPEDR